LATLVRCPADSQTRNGHSDGTVPAFASSGAGESRARGGRPGNTQDLRELIVRLAEENPELGSSQNPWRTAELGFTSAERTMARYLRRILHRNDSKRKWLAFLQNHREVIAAMDFFTVPRVTLRVLYCFLVIEHERRKILRCKVTQHPTAEWIVQQLREAFPGSCRDQ
jgi:hypothetical protein